MMTTDVLDHLRATLWRFSDRELAELLRCTAQEITRRDRGTGVHLACARLTWDGAILERRASSFLGERPTDR